jgi:hypothetical protein
MTNFTVVKLYIYDISHGLASAYGSTLLGRFFQNDFNRLFLILNLGKHIEGVWHTGVGVYGREYLFGGSGISYTAPEEVYRMGLAAKPKVYVTKSKYIPIDFLVFNLDVILVKRKNLLEIFKHGLTRKVPLIFSNNYI